MLKKLVLSLVLSLGFTSAAHAANPQVQCLAETIYHEAGNQPLKGKIAVANVVMNRAKQSSRFGSTPCAVISQRFKKHCQFSWKCTAHPIKNAQLFKNSVDIAEQVYYGKYTDVTNGSTFFHATYVKTGWHYKRMAQIGGHIFYKG